MGGRSRREVLRAAAVAGLPAGIDATSEDDGEADGAVSPTPVREEVDAVRGVQQMYTVILETFRNKGYFPGSQRKTWARLDRMDRIPFYHDAETDIESMALYQGDPVRARNEPGRSVDEIVADMWADDVEPADKQRLLDYRLLEQDTIPVRLVDVYGDGEEWMQPLKTFVGNRLSQYYAIAGADRDIDITVETDSVDHAGLVDHAAGYDGALQELLNVLERERWDEYHIYLTGTFDYRRVRGEAAPWTGAAFVRVPQSVRDRAGDRNRTKEETRVYRAATHELYHLQQLLHTAYDGLIDENWRNYYRTRQLLTGDISFAQPSPDMITMEFEPGPIDPATRDQEFLAQIRALLEPDIDLAGWQATYREEQPPNQYPRPVDVATFSRTVGNNLAMIDLHLQYNNLIDHDLTLRRLH